MNSYNKIISLLNKNNIRYEELEHEPIYTTEDAAMVKGLSLESGAKSILLKAKNDYILVVVSGSDRIDSKKLKKILSIKDLRFASPAEVKDKMGCIIGACFPFGSIINIQTYMDEHLLKHSTISFSPGAHDKSIKLLLSDYLLIENPQVVDVSA